MPDHSTVSRRAVVLPPLPCIPAEGEVHILIDSTGLKVYGAGQWLEEKHGIRLRARRFAAQRTEVAIGVAVLNRLLSVTRPHSVRKQVSSA